MIYIKYSDYGILCTCILKIGVDLALPLDYYCFPLIISREGSLRTRNIHKDNAHCGAVTFPNEIRILSQMDDTNL